MITAVLDANTLASGAIAQTGTLALILDAWRDGAFGVVVSRPILQELERTFQKPYFTQRLTLAQRTGFLTLVARQSVVTTLTVEVHGIATHPEDDLILATAVSASADFLVTGDSKLRDLQSHLGVTIVNPRRFLDYLATEEGSEL